MNGWVGRWMRYHFVSIKTICTTSTKVYPLPLFTTSFILIILESKWKTKSNLTLSPFKCNKHHNSPKRIVEFNNFDTLVQSERRKRCYPRNPSSLFNKTLRCPFLHPNAPESHYFRNFYDIHILELTVRLLLSTVFGCVRYTISPVRAVF